MVNKQKKLLDEFANGFIQALKENSIECFQDFIFSEENLRKLKNNEKYEDLLNKMSKFIKTFSSSFLEDINKFSIQSITPRKMNFGNDLFDAYQIEVILEDSKDCQLTFNLRYVFTNGKIVQFYPDIKRNIKYKLKNKDERKNLIIQNTMQKGQGFTYKDFRAKYDDIDGGYLQEYILFFEGDLVIDGNLNLDAFTFSIVVKGNLSVKGDIENYNCNYGATLLVLGETHANNIIAGGAVIDLNDTYVTGFVIGHYNDGILMISKLHKGILYSDDHYTDVELGKNAYSFTDLGLSGENQFMLEDAGEIFEDQKIVNSEIDDGEIYYSINLNNINASLGDYDNFITKIKAYQKQKLGNKSNYESIEFSTFESIRDLVKRKRDFDIDVFLYDMGLRRSASVKILHGNQEIDGDFCLNFDEIQADCLLVRGDLDISGTIYSNPDKKVAKLAVLGEIKCHNFAIANAHVYVKQSIKTKEVFFYHNSLTEDIKLSMKFGAIDSPLVIFEGNINFDEYINEDCHVFSDTSSIENANALEDLIKILLAEFYQQKKKITLNSKIIIDTLIDKKPIYDNKILEQTDKNDNAFRRRWFKAFSLVCKFLTKHNIDYNFEQTDYHFKLTIEANSFINLPNELQERTKEYNIGITVFTNEREDNMYCQWYKHLNGELYEEVLLNFFRLTFKNQFTLTFAKNKYIGKVSLINLKDKEEKFIFFDKFKDLNKDKIEKAKKAHTFTDVTTHFNIPINEIDMLVGKLERLFG